MEGLELFAIGALVVAASGVTVVHGLTNGELVGLVHLDDTSEDMLKNGERVGSIRLDDTSDEGSKMIKVLGKGTLMTVWLASDEAEVPYDGSAMVLELAPDKLASGMEKEMPLVVPLPMTGVMVGYVGYSVMIVGLGDISGSEVTKELMMTLSLDGTAEDLRTTVLVMIWVMVERTVVVVVGSAGSGVFLDCQRVTKNVKDQYLLVRRSSIAWSSRDRHRLRSGNDDSSLSAGCLGTQVGHDGSFTTHDGLVNAKRWELRASAIARCHF
jgi:hypothetical protein